MLCAIYDLDAFIYLKSKPIIFGNARVARCGLFIYLPISVLCFVNIDLSGLRRETAGRTNTQTGNLVGR